MENDNISRAHALLGQVMSNDLNVKEVNVTAVRSTLSDIRGLLERELGMTAPPPKRDALEPQERVKAFSADSGAESSGELFGDDESEADEG